MTPSQMVQTAAHDIPQDRASSLCQDELRGFICGLKDWRRSSYRSGRSIRAVERMRIRGAPPVCAISPGRMRETVRELECQASRTCRKTSSTTAHGTIVAVLYATMTGNSSECAEKTSCLADQRWSLPTASRSHKIRSACSCLEETTVILTIKHLGEGRAATDESLISIATSTILN